MSPPMSNYVISATKVFHGQYLKNKKRSVYHTQS